MRDLLNIIRPLFEAESEKLIHGSTKGHLGEFIIGAAIVAKFIKGAGTISVDDATAVISETAKTPNLSAEFVGVSADKIRFQNVISNKKNIADAKESQTPRIMSAELQAAVKYANSEASVVKWSKIFAENGKPDEILVKAAGEEDQKGTKADIFLIYIDTANGKNRIFKALSIKTNSALVGQASPRTFNNMQVFFNDLGITLQPIDDYQTNVKQHVTSILNQVVADLNALTTGDDDAKESILIQNIANFLNKHVGMNDPKLQVVNIGKGDYSVQTVKKMISNLPTVDLQTSLKAKGQPTVIVHRAGNLKDILFQIRYTYSPARIGKDRKPRAERHRMFVEMGSLWKTLGTITRKDVEQDAVQQPKISESRATRITVSPVREKR
jgi:hypothetical protein